MVIGVPTEVNRQEHRVGLTPHAVSRLTEHGHKVVIQSGAGLDARFLDRQYQDAGAQTVYDAEEVYQRADLVCRVGFVSDAEVALLKSGSTLCGFQHLAVASRETVERLMAKETTLIGYELIRDAAGGFPVLVPFSRMAGCMAVHLAAFYLQNEFGGRGVLIGNVPGVPPPTVLILGAGSVGQAAAQQALAAGAHVIVFDEDLTKLARLDHETSLPVVTVVASDVRLGHYTSIADVVIGAVRIPGVRAPFVVTRKMVHAMKPGSVIIDVSIDQGGCVETSRPTTLADPTFLVGDVLHYCVPNLTSNVARTASRALVNSALPYLLTLADRGCASAIRDDPALAAGTLLFRGRLVDAAAAAAMGLPWTELNGLPGRG